MKMSSYIRIIFSKKLCWFNHKLLLLTLSVFYFSVPVFAQNVFYSIHVGSYKNEDQAQSKVLAYKSMGYDSFHRYVNIIGKGDWYRIYIGKYGTQKEAEIKAQNIKRFDIISFYNILKLEDEITEAPEAKPIIKSELESENMTISQLLIEEDILIKSEAESEMLEQLLSMPEPVTKDEMINQTQLEMGIVQHSADSFYEVPDEEPENNLRSTVTYQNNIRIDDYNKFSILLKTGFVFLLNTENFEIERESTDLSESWNISNTRSWMIGITPTLYFNGHLGVYGNIEKIMSDKLDSIMLSIGPQYTYILMENLLTEFKIGLVYGDLDWDGVPGQFSDSFGGEIASGIYLIKNSVRLRVGFEFMYRGIMFDSVTSG